MWAPARVGLLLVGPARKLISANAEALRILAYPKAPPDVRSPKAFLGDRLGGLLSGKSREEAASSAEIRFGRRGYLCLLIPLVSPPSDPRADLTAVLIERPVHEQAALRRLSEEYNLTPRERESVELLARGLTNNAIAHRMGLRPGTVKTFLRLVMTKMAVPTRSAVMARLVELSRPADRLHLS